jgi:tRNA1Val (adenine37-N6)-methyltransferase
MNFPDLAGAAAYLLKPKGRLFMIYHPERILEASDILRAHRLEPKKIRFVHNDSGAESKIVLIESVKGGRPGLKIEKPLYIYQSEGVYSREVTEIYGKYEPDPLSGSGDSKH